MFSGVKKLMKKDSISLTDVYELIDDICDKVYVMLQITLVIGFTLGAISMAIVNKIAGQGRERNARRRLQQLHHDGVRVARHDGSRARLQSRRRFGRRERLDP